MLFIGIDPGKSGAIAAIDEEGRFVSVVKLKETEQDVWTWMLKELGIGYGKPSHFAVLEKVGAMPRQGLSSTFKFGVSYGFCRGILTANRVRFEEVTPAKWQGALGCRTKGDKNITKSKAQQMHPDQKITHANADALLLAEYARRLFKERLIDGSGDRVE